MIHTILHTDIFGIAALSVCSAALLLNLFYLRKRAIASRYRGHVPGNMPVGYSRAKVSFTPEGLVRDIVYRDSNTVFRGLLEKHSGTLFPAEYIAPFVSRLFESREPVVFTRHFDLTGVSYEFTLCLAGKNPGKGLIDIFATDVTSAKKREEELGDSVQRLGLTLRLARVTSWRWNLRDHTVTYEAPRDPYTPATINDSDYFERIHPEDVDRVKGIFRNFMEGQVSSAQTEYRVQTPEEGGIRTDWVRVDATVTACDDSGKPLVLTGALAVITERKEREADLVAACEKASKSDHMKSAFLANMSHEIRTPLNAIVGFSNLLMNATDPEKKRKFMGIIENNSSLLLQLIGDVLDLAKVEAGTLDFYYQPVDLNGLMRTIENTVRLRVKPEVSLFCLPGSSECVANTEPNRLSQVLINLLTNSAKFTSQGSITFSYEIRGAELFFTVRDTGVGIPVANQHKLFQRFSKLHDCAQGTGLGLSISKGIVEKMGGTIGCESAGEGQGATFWFTIPYVPAELEKQSSALTGETLGETAGNEEITLLVAEDNANNFMLMEAIFEGQYRLIHAWDGKEAVELFKEHRPQAILMDLSMPRMDGYEATREIRKISPEVPIIAVTAYAFASDKKRVLDSGFNGYISKPLDPDKVIRELKSMLGKQHHPAKAECLI